MLYLLEPTWTLKWVDFPASMAREAVAQHGADLGKLDWRSDTDKSMSEDLLAVGLRHGMACSAGIAVEAIHIINLFRAQQIRQITAEARELHQNLAKQDEFMERLIPGWVAHGEALQMEIDEGSERSAQEAEAAAAELLAAPIKPELEAHWLRLGGPHPN